jgi:hypothetical protein
MTTFFYWFLRGKIAFPLMHNGIKEVTKSVIPRMMATAEMDLAKKTKNEHPVISVRFIPSEKYHDLHTKRMVFQNIVAVPNNFVKRKVRLESFPIYEQLVYLSMSEPVYDFRYFFSIPVQ